MRVGLLSDTHVPEAPGLWPEIFVAFRDVDLILHAGDLVQVRVLDELEAAAPVLAAQGNHDLHITDDPRVRPLHLLELEGHTVAMLHYFEPVESRREWQMKRFLQGVWPDVVVHGDTHFERIDMVAGALCINPGSATLPRNMTPRLGHVGFLTLERGKPPRAEIVHLSEFSTVGRNTIEAPPKGGASAQLRARAD